MLSGGREPIAAESYIGAAADNCIGLDARATSHVRRDGQRHRTGNKHQQISIIDEISKQISKTDEDEIMENP